MLEINFAIPHPLFKKRNATEFRSSGGDLMTIMPFFVYGSMSEGMVHFSKIKDFIDQVTPASTTGTAYRLPVGFPALTQEGSDSVEGTLVKLRTSDLLLSLLDQFFGLNRQDESKSLYFRKQISVKTQDNQTVEAWCYLINPAKIPNTAVKIENGDWIHSLKTKPALTDILTEKQRAYLLKLGASSGREIVPIDLALYRELMNLEMIVDKGRRLALSKLGHEVYRHLT
jgi:gamma-glutamylcyclotransferase (GGCT)/AIG2-like uncharacterized protein YtfP